MKGQLRLCRTEDVPTGCVRTISAEGKKIALANIGGTFFAVSDACTHRECSLGTDGSVDGGSIVCGCHGARFDAATGKALSLPAVTDVETYDVTVKNGEIFIVVPTP